MFVINDFNECLELVVDLGFTVPPGTAGWIIEAQKRMCDTTDLLLNASGQNSWFWQEFTPFEVCFRYDIPLFYVLNKSDIFKKVDPVKSTIKYLEASDVEYLEGIGR